MAMGVTDTMESLSHNTVVMEVAGLATTGSVVYGGRRPPSKRIEGGPHLHGRGLREGERLVSKVDGGAMMGPHGGDVAGGDVADLCGLGSGW
ncbi:hypothetical protein NL676_001785 [Syzygium grande]|nr:hypothetical protein NL676_001785 [Syzygium grande]